MGESRIIIPQNGPRHHLQGCVQLNRRRCRGMGEPAVGACMDDHSQKGRDVVQTQVIVLSTGKSF